MNMFWGCIPFFKYLADKDGVTNTARKVMEKAALHGKTHDVACPLRLPAFIYLMISQFEYI